MKIYMIFLLVIFNVKLNKSYFHSGFWEYCDPLSKGKPPMSLKTFSTNIYQALPGFVFHGDEDQFDSVKSINCTFNIKAPSGKKLFAMVQSMKFDSSCNDKCCSDSIEFKTGAIVKQGPYCGSFQKNTRPADNNDYKVNKYYKYDKFGVYSNNGEIQMTIIYSEKSMQQKYYHDLNVVFTTYSDYNKDISEESVNNSRVGDVFLNKKFICDGIKNCPDQICDDEKNCDDKNSSDLFYNELFFIIEIILIIILLTILIVFYFWKLRKSSSHFTEQIDPSDYQIRLQSILNRETAIISGPTDYPHVDPPPTYESLFKGQLASQTDDGDGYLNK